MTEEQTRKGKRKRTNTHDDDKSLEDPKQRGSGWEVIADGHLPTIRAWINSGADVNVTFSIGKHCTPLQFVCSDQFIERNPGDRVVISKLLLAAKADVNAFKGYFSTPLIEASYDKKPNLDLVRTLVEAKANFIAPHHKRFGTVFHWIGTRGFHKLHIDVASFLLDNVSPWFLFMPLDNVSTKQKTKKSIFFHCHVYNRPRLKLLPKKEGLMNCSIFTSAG